MSNLLVTILSLSVIGSVLSGLLFLLRPIFKFKVSRAFSYYLWLVVPLRLCLPFGVSMVIPSAWISGGTTETATNATATETGSVITTTNNPVNQITQASVQSKDPQSETISAPEEASAVSSTDTAQHPHADLIEWLKNPAVWMTLWATGAAICFGWHVIGYGRYVYAIKRSAELPDEADLEVFQEFPESRRVRLLRSAFVKTPMLLGVLRPTVLLPVSFAQNGLAERLRDILRHELTHYRRRDMVYKWFAVLVTSLHWFNPIMIPIRREISRACELSSDEAVIARLSSGGRQHYGETLLFLASGQKLSMGLLATTLCEEKTQLRERIVSIVRFRRKTGAAALLSVVLCIALVGCAAVSGVKTAEQATQQTAEASGLFQEDVTLFQEKGMTIAIPSSYVDQLKVMPGTDSDTYLCVYEKESYEESMADDGLEAGFIFSIMRFTQAQYEGYLSAMDNSGYSVFARDDTYYYCWCFATDVQFYRTGVDYALESDAMDDWVALNRKCDAVQGDFIARNHLRAYSDSEFTDRDFTYDGAHRYFIYYPYYAYPSLAQQETTNWMYTLVLSQPVTQGVGGIWCVESWSNYDDGYGQYVFPTESGETAAEYYTQQQSAADKGENNSLLDPMQVALSFAKTYFGHDAATKDSFVEIPGDPAGNIRTKYYDVLDDIGTIQTGSYSDDTLNTSEAVRIPDETKETFSRDAGAKLNRIQWLKADAPRKGSGDVILCKNSDGSKTLSFYQQDQMLCIETSGTQEWFKPAYDYGVLPYDSMLEIYETYFPTTGT